MNTKLHDSSAASPTGDGTAADTILFPPDSFEANQRLRIDGVKSVTAKRNGHHRDLEDKVSLKTQSPPARLTATSKPPSDGAASTRRQFVFRMFRAAMAGGLMTAGVLYARSTLTTVRSEKAYIIAEMTALRAPIAGRVALEAFAPGQWLTAGTPLFRVENARFGNEEASAQMNWANEAAERLLAEIKEAEVRVRHQEQIYRIHEKLHEEQLISRLALLEEKEKLEFARSLMANKEALAAQAQCRRWDIERQVELQRAALVAMPFDGVAWAVAAKSGAEVSTRESVVELIDPKRIRVDAFFLERQAGRVPAGARVEVRSLDGRMHCGGTVEWVRGGVGRIPAQPGQPAAASVEDGRRRIAVRVKLDGDCIFPASEFLGVGRSVVVTLANHE